MDDALREMIDRQAIWQVMVRFARGLDRLDTALALTCYWEDAIEDHGRFVGTAEGFLAWWSQQVAPMFLSTHHAIMNQFCEIDGDDAHAETYYIFTGTYPKAPHFMSTGRYIDHFQRRGGEWRFANRVTIVEGTFDLPESVASAALPSAYAPGETNPASRGRDDASYQRPLVPRRPKVG
jgi:hypothetical protein